VGKSKKPKVEVNFFYMSIHFGICIVVDAIRSIIIKEKTAWSGFIEEPTDISISKRDLFGGDQKEGGAIGEAYFLPGLPDQVMPDELATRLGRADGSDCPGFRGIASLFFHRHSTTRGFYWTANSPYLPGVWTKVTRIYTRSDGEETWYAAKAGIPVDGFVPTPPYATASANPSFGGDNLFFSPAYATLYSGSYNGLTMFDAATQTIDVAVDDSFAGTDIRQAAYEGRGFLALKDGPDDLWQYDADGNGTDLGTGSLRYLATSYDGNTWHWAARDRSAPVHTYFDGNDIGVLGGTQHELFTDLDGGTWLIQNQGGDVEFTQMVGSLDDWPGTVTVSAGSLAGGFEQGSGAVHFRDDTHDHFVFTAGGTTYAIDSTGAVVFSIATPAVPAYRSIRPGVSTIWAGRKEISLVELTLVLEIDPARGRCPGLLGPRHGLLDVLRVRRLPRHEPGAHHPGVPDEHRLGHGDTRGGA
jgi:hypothetical protein